MPIEKLISGFKSFRADYFEKQPEVYQDLVENGQHPDVMVIACADSRVNPSLITQAGPGELFVIRNVANLVPPSDAGDQLHGMGAAIEFGVKDLKVKTILVLGHSHCGGIKWMSAGHKSPENREYIDSWVATALPARPDDVTEESLRRAEKNAVTISLENLLTYPWVKDAVEAGELELVGWLFDLESGQLVGFNGEGWETVG